MAGEVSMFETETWIHRRFLAITVRIPLGVVPTGRSERQERDSAHTVEGAIAVPKRERASS